LLLSLVVAKLALVESGEYTLPKALGGVINVYTSESLSKGKFAGVTDLAVAAVSKGCQAGFKPHMVLPSPSGEHVAIAYTGDSKVHVLDAKTREILICIDVADKGFTKANIHTAYWHGNDVLLLTDMVSDGGSIHKYRIASGEAVYVSTIKVGGAAVSTARGTNATRPISIGGNPAGAFKDTLLVVDGSGGASFIDVATDAIVGSLKASELSGATGGLWVHAHATDPSLVIAQYGTQRANGSYIFVVSLDSKTVVNTIQVSGKAVDSHGLAYCEAADGTTYALTVNRISSTLDIFSLKDYSFAVRDFDLTNGGKLGLQPDLVSFKSGKLYITGRGPKPVSAVAQGNFNPKAVAGLYTVSVADCTGPSFGADDVAVPAAALTLLDADFHGGSFVGEEYWGLDQQGTHVVNGLASVLKFDDNSTNTTAAKPASSALPEPIPQAEPAPQQTDTRTAAPKQTDSRTLAPLSRAGDTPASAQTKQPVSGANSVMPAHGVLLRVALLAAACRHLVLA